AALRIGPTGHERFLIESHDIALAPSVRMYLSREPGRSKVAPTRQMLLVADPVYELSDARLAKVATKTSASDGASARPLADDSLGAKLLALFRGANAEG